MHKQPPRDARPLALAPSHLSPTPSGITHADPLPAPTTDPAVLPFLLPRTSTPPVSARLLLPLEAQPRRHLIQEALVVTEVPPTWKCRVCVYLCQLAFRGASVFKAESTLLALTTPRVPLAPQPVKSPPQGS